MSVESFQRFSDFRIRIDRLESLVWRQLEVLPELVKTGEVPGPRLESMVGISKLYILQ